MDDTCPLTLGDWRGAYLCGASPRALLGRWHERLDVRAGADDAAWIARLDASSLAAQLDLLEARAAAWPSREAALAALPLFGVPFAVKDNIDAAGFATTAACPAFAYRPRASAAAVRRLVEAGAVCAGKANLDQFATGLVGTRSPYGRAGSVFDAARVSGGSSSGSAMAVARGDVPFALGTDTAGSGRVPAGFNNVVGLKPTPGRVSTAGVVPACRSLDCVSVFALDVRDAALVLSLIEGDDADDPYSDFRAGPARLPARPRIGVPRDAHFAGDAGYAAAFEQAVRQAAELGGEIVALDFAPLLAVGDLLYDGPWVAERHTVVQPLLDRDPDAIEPSVRRVVEAARALTATDAFRGFHRLKAAARECAGYWRQADLLMVPTAPGHPTFAQVDADPLGANAALGRYTNFVNLLGWCALALPAGFTARGLPFGATFIAPGACDAALARWGRTWQAALGTAPGAPGLGVRLASSGDDLARRPASEPTLALAVVGAHLSGMPLNGQLVERGAVLRGAARTAPRYRLHALPGTVPPKPGLVRVAEGDEGASIALEVWDVPVAAVGSFLALVPPPLAIGSVELDNGQRVHGFLCESQALDGAADVSAFGGWRAYVASLAAGPTA